MKVISVVVATLLMSGSLVLAQGCPCQQSTSAGTVCLVPASPCGSMCNTAAVPGPCCASTSIPNYQAAGYPSYGYNGYPSSGYGYPVPSWPTTSCLTPSCNTCGTQAYYPTSCNTCGSQAYYPTNCNTCGTQAYYPAPCNTCGTQAYYPTSCNTCGAQTCPTSTCNTCNTQPTCASTCLPVVSQTVPYSPCASVQGGCPTTPDTQCIINELEALRNDVRAARGTVATASLVATGMALVNRINALQIEELDFRTALAASQSATTPMHDGQVMATRLMNQAVALNQDIVSFNQALAMITPDQRPYMAADLNNFDVTFWTPALQHFACYNTQFQQSMASSYQPLYATFPWLQCWLTNYQTSLNSIAMVPQTFASCRWWCSAGPVVFGAVQPYPCGTCANANQFGQGGFITTANGSTIFVPAGSVPIANTCGVCATQTPCPTCGMGMTTCPVTAPVAAPTPAPTPQTPPVPPVTRGAD